MGGRGPGSDPRIVPDVAWRDDVFSVEKRRDLVEKGEHLLRVVGDANPLSARRASAGRGVSSSTLRGLPLVMRTRFNIRPTRGSTRAC